MTAPQFAEKASAAAAVAGITNLFVFGEANGFKPFATLLEGDDRARCHNQSQRRSGGASLFRQHNWSAERCGLTHHNLVSNLRQMEGLDYFTSEDTLLCVLPLFHIYGLVVILNMGLYQGATIVMMPRFDLEQFLQTVSKYKVTLAHLVPPIVLALSKSPLVDEYDLSTLRAVFPDRTT